VCNLEIGSIGFCTGTQGSSEASMSTLLDEPCIPGTCESFGAGCGQHDDGCGGTIDCGACCTPRDYCNQGECGIVDDGCGGAMDCGPCTTPAPAPEVTCIAEGERCVNDGQCCAGLCRGRGCEDRGRKSCQAACAA
jgi:hypothetical protein